MKDSGYKNDITESSNTQSHQDEIINIIINYRKKGIFLTVYQVEEVYKILEKTENKNLKFYTMEREYKKLNGKDKKDVRDIISYIKNTFSIK